MKLNELINLEKKLLELDLNHKFELEFNDALKLYGYLKDIGRITNYAFLLQDEFYKRYNDVEKLKEYHIKIINSDVEFDCSNIISFLDKFETE